jgi:hypothetical protein
MYQDDTKPANPCLDNAQLLQRLSDGADRLLHVDGPRYRRLWAYYRNPMNIVAVEPGDTAAQRPYRQAQEWGLPSRITGVRSATEINEGVQVDGLVRKEIVIENDIGWRIDTMVDSLFGKPLVISSAAPDPARRPEIAQLLRLIFAANGGVTFLQQMALLGSVHGFVDVLVKLNCSCIPPAEPSAASTGCGAADLGQPPVDDDRHHAVASNLPADAPTSASMVEGDAPSTIPAPTPPATESARGDDVLQANDPEANHTVSPDVLTRIARMIRLEIVEPARALPVLSQSDVRTVDAYAQAYPAPRPPAPTRRAYKTRWIDRVKRSATGLLGARDPKPLPVGNNDRTVFIVDVVTADQWRRYEDDKLVASGVNSLGAIPLVHIQNVADPFAYEAAGDVEPLIPLQDELNIRLSDRANRITLQSFKMYLGQGIDDFTDLPIIPGQMWSTENVDADVVSFGGDANCPSEESHIAEVREALDKTSGVTPIAAGAIKGRIGRLTSAAALRITLQALLNRTEKKRTTYGAAIERLCELSLAWLDTAGVFKTTPQERRVELHWPSPIPQNESELLEQAAAKLRIGVPQEIVLRELGYEGATDVANQNDETEE